MRSPPTCRPRLWPESNGSAAPLAVPHDVEAPRPRRTREEQKHLSSQPPRRAGKQRNPALLPDRAPTRAIYTFVAFGVGAVGAVRDLAFQMDASRPSRGSPSSNRARPTRFGQKMKSFFRMVGWCGVGDAAEMPQAGRPQAKQIAQQRSATRSLAGQLTKARSEPKTAGRDDLVECSTSIRKRPRLAVIYNKSHAGNYARQQLTAARLRNGSSWTRNLVKTTAGDVGRTARRMKPAGIGPDDLSRIE